MSKLYTADRFVTIGGTTAQYVTGTGSLVTFPAIPTGADYIQNQNASAQSANMWISGSGIFNSSVTASTFTANDATYGALNFTGGTSNGVVGSFGDSLRLINFTSAGTTTIQGNADININSVGANNIILKTSNTERMRINASGNVGIGTTSPDSKLDVTGGDITVNTSGTGFMNFKYGSVGSEGAIGTVTTDGINIAYNATNALTFGTGGTTERMRVTVSGSVGIGTTTPAEKLEVIGKLRVSNGGSPFYYAELAGLYAEQTGYLAFRGGGGPGMVISSENYGYQTAIWSYDSEKIRISQAGNVGIGTTSPNALLHLYKNNSPVTFRLQSASPYAYPGDFSIQTGGYGSNDFIIYDNTAGAERLYINSVGNVGIGTTTPFGNAKLQIRPISNVNIAFQPSNGLSSGGKINAFDDAASVNVNLELNGLNLGFKTNETERMRITAAGNVGIGTSSPGSILSILKSSTYNDENSGGIEIATGTANTNAKLILGTVGDSYSYIQSMQQDWDWTSRPLSLMPNGGNVGIGTSSPTAKLDLYTNGDQTLRFSHPTSGTFPRTDRIVFGSPEIDGGSSAIYGVQTAASGAPGYLSFYTTSGGASGERMRITSDGNVGIGITSPTTPIYVAGGPTGTGGWNKTATLSATYPTLIFNSSSSKWGGMAYDYSSAMRFWVDAVSDDIYIGRLAMSILNSGNVGIGVTNPVVKLQVDGTITSTGTLTAYTSAPSINIGHNGDSAFIAATSGDGANTPISFSVGNNAEKMRITAAGNVGIGTTSPGAKLNIAGPLGSTVGGGGSSIKMTNTDTGNFASISAGIVGISNSGMEFSVNGNRAAVIDTLGNVGIGTTSPQYTLDVNGTSRSTTFRVDDATGSTGLLIYSGAPSGAGAIARLLKADSTKQVYQSFENDSLYLGIAANQTSVADIGTKGGVNMVFSTAYSERMRINTSGNVGIGTSSPANKLHVDGAANNVINSANAISRIGWNHAGGGVGIDFGGLDGTPTYGAWIQASRATDNAAFQLLLNPSGGNVGIGTTSPTGLLHIYGTDAAFRIQNNGTGNMQFGQWDTVNNRIQSSGRDFLLTQTDSFNMLFHTNSTERMRITSGGNIGIGTSSPSNKLVAVNNAIYDQEDTYAIAAAAATDSAYKTVIGYDYGNDIGVIAAVRQGIGWRNLSVPQGNLGIGNVGPTQKLHVTGNARITGAIYDSSNSAGTSGQVLSSTGTGTAWVTGGGGGGISGSGTTNYVPKFTSSTNIGNSNISDSGTLVTISTDALINGVTVGRGGSNDITDTAVGYQALQSQASGGKSTAIGVQALANSTSGYVNVGIGFQALFGITTGEYNLGVGAGAGSGIITGDYNNIIGNSLVFDPSGNSFDGSYSLSIGKNSLAHEGYPQIWSPESITCTDATTTTILSIDPAIYKAFFMDYCFHNDTENSSKVGSFFGTFRSAAGGITFPNPNVNQVTNGVMNDVVIDVAASSGDIIITVQNDAGYDIQADYTVRLILR